MKEDKWDGYYNEHSFLRWDVTLSCSCEESWLVKIKTKMVNWVRYKKKLQQISHNDEYLNEN